jgi:hypothetical protein
MVSKNDLKIFIIHNKEARVNALIQTLLKCKNNHYSFEIEEIYEQKPRIFKFYHLIYFKMSQLKITINWSKYLYKKIKPKQIIEILIQIFKLLVSREFFNSFNTKIGIIDSISKKHFEALSSFLNSKSKFMLVLESDAIIPDKKNFDSELIKVMNFSKGREGIFAVLGNSYTLDKLGAENISYRIVDGLRIYEKPLTNTVVAYVLDRKAASIIKNRINNYSDRFPFLPFDWLINWVFCQLDVSVESITGIEIIDSCVIHGSVSGITKSWQ